jgi:hypothetical protein
MSRRIEVTFIDWTCTLYSFFFFKAIVTFVWCSLSKVAGLKINSCVGKLLSFNFIMLKFLLFVLLLLNSSLTLSQHNLLLETFNFVLPSVFVIISNPGLTCDYCLELTVQLKLAKIWKYYRCIIVVWYKQ